MFPILSSLIFTCCDDVTGEFWASLGEVAARVDCDLVRAGNTVVDEVGAGLFNASSSIGAAGVMFLYHAHTHTRIHVILLTFDF